MSELVGLHLRRPRGHALSTAASELRTYDVGATRAALAPPPRPSCGRRLATNSAAPPAPVTSLLVRTALGVPAFMRKRGYVTLNELRKGGARLHLEYNGPSVAVQQAKPKKKRYLLKAILVILLMMWISEPIAVTMMYFTPLERETFDKILLWWFRYYEVGQHVISPTATQIVDGMELAGILETKVGVPHSIQIIEKDDFKARRESFFTNLEGGVLMLVSRMVHFLGFNFPIITFSFYLRMRWEEKAKIVGPKGSAQMVVTLRTILKPDKIDLSTKLLNKRKGLMIDQVKIIFPDSTSVMLNNASFGRHKHTPNTKLKK